MEGILEKILCEERSNAVKFKLLKGPLSESKSASESRAHSDTTSDHHHCQIRRCLCSVMTVDSSPRFSTFQEGVSMR
jgi:hypothetical protein